MKDASPIVNAGSRMCQPITQKNCRRERISGSSVIGSLRQPARHDARGSGSWLRARSGRIGPCYANVTGDARAAAPAFRSVQETDCRHAPPSHIPVQWPPIHAYCRAQPRKLRPTGDAVTDADLVATRAAIIAAERTSEPVCVPTLIVAARLPDDLASPVQALAARLVRQLRADRTRASGVDALMREFSLSSQEGVALMCLAEALLRIPDTANRDRLIRDKLGGADWRSHVGASPSLFVNAASWGLVITGKLVATSSEQGLSAAIGRLLTRGGEPLIRRGLDLAMRLLGRQFVLGQTIAEALDHARPNEAKGYLLFLRHARRGGDDGGRCGALRRTVSPGDRCHRRGQSRPRRARGRRHLDQTVGIASALWLQPSRVGWSASCCRCCATWPSWRARTTSA